jgi:hypothetical protein
MLVNITLQFLVFTLHCLCIKVFADTKGVITIRKSKKNRQHNGQKKKDKRTNNDLQNTKHWPTRTSVKLGINSIKMSSSWSTTGTRRVTIKPQEHYNYLWNQYPSPLTLWVWIPHRRDVLIQHYVIKCQWLATGHYTEIKVHSTVVIRQTIEWLDTWCTWLIVIWILALS